MYPIHTILYSFSHSDDDSPASNLIKICLHSVLPFNCARRLVSETTRTRDLRETPSTLTDVGEALGRPTALLCLIRRLG